MIEMIIGPVMFGLVVGAAIGGTIDLIKWIVR